MIIIIIVITSTHPSLLRVILSVIEIYIHLLVLRHTDAPSIRILSTQLAAERFIELLVYLNCHGPIFSRSPHDYRPDHKVPQLAADG